MNLKLSIIIPCYNSEKTLREAVDSCYLQGFKDDEFEIVIVDDGSTDDTKKIITDLATKKSNIKYSFNKKNVGGGNTRNTAVSLSSADIIFCLDSDDMLPPNTLKVMSEYLVSNHCDGVAFNYSIKFKGSNIGDVEYIDEFDYVGQKIPLTSLTDAKSSCPLHVVFMFTKNAFLKAGGYPSHGFDTQGFAWRFLTAGLNAHVCPKTKYYHRIQFNKSYYLREIERGMINYNWKKILMENYELLSQKSKKLVDSFDYQDITRNVLEELKLLGNIFAPNFEQRLGKNNSKPDEAGENPIRRNSIRGILLRIKSRIVKLLKTKYPFLFGLLKKIYKAFYRNLIHNRTIYFLSSSTKPLSDIYGFDRGKPLDRYYIENFLRKNQDSIKGVCLELLNGGYTNTFGGKKVTESVVLDIDPSNANATLISDLRNLKEVPDNKFDCIILTQVMQFIDDKETAVSECYRILKPGGTLLATLPTLGRIDCASGKDGDFWRFTTAGAKYLFSKKFSPEKTEIESQGNARTGIYFLAGLATEDVPEKILATRDENFPTIVTLKAVK